MRPNDTPGPEYGTLADAGEPQEFFLSDRSFSKPAPDSTGELEQLFDEIQKVYRIERRLATTENLLARDKAKALIRQRDEAMRERLLAAVKHYADNTYSDQYGYAVEDNFDGLRQAINQIYGGEK